MKFTSKQISIIYSSMDAFTIESLWSLMRAPLTFYLRHRADPQPSFVSHKDLKLKIAFTILSLFSPPTTHFHYSWKEMQMS